MKHHVITTIGLLTLTAWSNATAQTPQQPAAEAPKSSAAQPASDAMITRAWKLPAPWLPQFTAAAATGPSAVKNWLISHGIIFEGPATAAFDAQGGQLLVRNNQAQLDLVDALITGQSAPIGTSTAKAPDLVIPKLELKDATPSQAFESISATTGLKILYTPTASEPRISISLTNVPVDEALRYVTSLANLKFSYATDGVHVTAQ